MFKKNVRMIVMLLVVAMMFVGCSPSEPSQSSTPPVSEPQSSVASEVEPQSSTAPEVEPQATTITDREGKEITVPTEVNAIISMAPSITETLINLGLGDKIVAVDTYSEGIEGLPADLPMFDMQQPNVEAIAELSADVMFASGLSVIGTEDPFTPIKDMGTIITYIPSPIDIEGIKADIKFLGDMTHTADEAAAIVADMESAISEITTAIADEEKGTTVYFEIAAAPYAYSFGSGTFLNEIIELLGATNILADSEGWMSVSEEVAVTANPQVIFTNVNYIENPVGEILSRASWQSVDAITNSRVYLVDANASSRGNENIVTAISEMAKALYPNSFN